MVHARVITATFPVVVIIMPRRWEPGWVEELDRRTKELFARREPFAIITDTRPVESIPGAKERKPLTEWLQRPDHLANQKRWNVASATIVGNALMRGALQAIYWAWTPPSPQLAAGDFDEAWTWCIEMLSKRNVPLPCSAEELAALAREELASLDPMMRRTPRDVV